MSCGRAAKAICYSNVHPIRIPRFRLPRFHPRVGLPRNHLFIGSDVRFSQGSFPACQNLNISILCKSDGEVMLSLDESRSRSWVSGFCIPGQALHEKGLQRQEGVGPVLSSQEQRAALAPRMNGSSRGSRTTYFNRSGSRCIMSYLATRTHETTYSYTVVP